MKSDQRGNSEHKDIVSKEKAIELAKDYGQYTYKVDLLQISLQELLVIMSAAHWRVLD